MSSTTISVATSVVVEPKDLGVRAVPGERPAKAIETLDRLVVPERRELRRIRAHRGQLGVYDVGDVLDVVELCHRRPHLERGAREGPTEPFRYVRHDPRRGRVIGMRFRRVRVQDAVRRAPFDDTYQVDAGRLFVVREKPIGM